MIATEHYTPPRIRGNEHPNRRARKNCLIKTDKPLWNQQAARMTGGRHSALTLTISAQMGMFTDISSQPSSPVSYPAPTFGALTNILRHLAPHLKTNWVPLGVEFLAPLSFTKFAFNLSSTGRKTVHEKEHTSSMFHHTVLENPRFRVYFAITNDDPQLAAATIQKIQQKVRSGNHRSLFMGGRDFPLHVEFSNPEEPTCEEINFQLASMLRQITYQPPGIEVFSDVTCENGVLVFPRTFQAIPTQQEN